MLTFPDSRGTIHTQKPDCDPAPGSSGNDFPIPKLEVLVPLIGAWMKQRRKLTGFGIY